ncbi:hypothetical protein AAFF_G00205300 [Aldrovandia affinis]|uniref:Uncharacterized protein n=1 Tax=Aldrovandia affinis TaxID=143900 RepID=A0AAD7RI83_9TELE|nr:hypothetical protein AAFF_G00205300 [Aldrovandia affinis]
MSETSSIPCGTPVLPRAFPTPLASSGGCQPDPDRRGTAHETQGTAQTAELVTEPRATLTPPGPTVVHRYAAWLPVTLCLLWPVIGSGR